MEDNNDLTEGFVTWSCLFFCEVLGSLSTFLVSVGYKADNINRDTLKMPPEVSFQVILKHLVGATGGGMRNIFSIKMSIGNIIFSRSDIHYLHMWDLVCYKMFLLSG